MNVSTRPPTFKSSSPFSNPLVTVPKTPITIGIIATFMFYIFFNSPARSRCLSFFSHSFSLLWSAGTARSTILKIRFFFFFFFFFWLIIIRSGLWSRLGDPCVCQNPIGVYVCHFLGKVLGCAYTICLNGIIIIIIIIIIMWLLLLPLIFFLLMMMIIIIIIFTNPSARAGCDTRSIFKRSLTGLNSEFSFS